MLTSIAATPTPAVPAARLYRLWSARDRTEGCAWRPDEPLAIAAFWLLLSRALPELRLVDHRGRPVTAWPRDLTTQADLLSRLQSLGLIVGSDPDWRVALPETAWFY